MTAAVPTMAVLATAVVMGCSTAFAAAFVRMLVLRPMESWVEARRVGWVLKADVEATRKPPTAEVVAIILMVKVYWAAMK